MERNSARNLTRNSGGISTNRELLATISSQWVRTEEGHNVWPSGFKEEISRPVGRPADPAKPGRHRNPCGFLPHSAFSRPHSRHKKSPAGGRLDDGRKADDVL